MMGLSRRTTVLAALSVFGLFLLWFFNQPESFEHATATVFAAIDQSDAKTLYEYMSPEEKERANATEANLAKLLAFWHKRTQGFVKFEELPLDTALYDTYAAKVYQHSDGRKTAISLPMRREGGRITVYCLTDNLTTAALRAEWPAAQIYPNDMRRKLFFLAAYAKNQAELTATGITGAQMIGEEEGTYDIYSWKEITDRLSASFAKYERENPEEASALLRSTAGNPLYSVPQ
ncbi:hypothetical protein BH11ARM1_BH11ARM1_17070 [soil metagenome]